MGFQPSAVFRLLDSGHDVCGCICPNRRLDEQAFFHASRQVSSFDAAKLLSTTFVGQKNLSTTQKGEGRGYEIRNGFVPTIGIGMGITLISVNALRKMIETCQHMVTNSPTEFYRHHGLNDSVGLFFDPIVRPGEEALYEDYSFCHRWTKEAGGKIFALIDEEIAHVGEYVASGNLLKKLRATPTP